MARTKNIACLIVLLAALFVFGCSRPRSITVGSKNFTEQVVLGEIMALHIERRLGMTVDRRLNLGGTLLAHGALVAGEIDLYPEYTGTALMAVLKLRPSSDPEAVLAEVRKQYRARWDIDWLDPLGFSNTFALVIRGEDARLHQIRTLSDAARRGAGWRLGAGYEFAQRPDGLAGLMETYRLPLKGAPLSMDLGLLYRALNGGQVDMVAANSTDGMLSVLDVCVLKDDRGYFPPYEAAVAVRSEALAAHPGLREALSELSGTFSDEIMRELNYQADGGRLRARDVAAKFLERAGLGP